MFLYKTIAKEIEVEQVIGKSRFISHIKPISNRDEAENFIKKIKKKYKDATHNVPAIIVGDKMQIQWASDDGEPQGTAGIPMVKFFVNEGITNLVIVVTRYFGGIKLGTGGLVRAYTSSAKLALENAGVKLVEEKAEVVVKIDYKYFDMIEKMLVKSGCEIKKTDFFEKILIKFLTDYENLGNIVEQLTSVTKATCEVLEMRKVEL